MRIVSIVAALAFGQVAVGQTPLGSAFVYQGQLREGGAPANGDYDFRFILYSAEIGGSQSGDIVYHEDVPVTNGLFIVSLDFGDEAFAGDVRWLEVAVRAGAGTGAHVTLTPRHELTPTPFALYAKTAGSIASEDDPQVGTIDTNSLAKWDGSALVTSTVTDDGTNVGVGVASPAARLDVGGGIAVNNSHVINSLGQWVGDSAGLRGTPCWDLNDNGEGDVSLEDASGDGVVDVLDCLGLAGPPGAPGAPGPAGADGATGPKGDKPAHMWLGTNLAFQNPDGSWGDFVNLQGPPGSDLGCVTNTVYCRLPIPGATCDHVNTQCGIWERTICYAEVESGFMCTFTCCPP